MKVIDTAKIIAISTRYLDPEVAVLSGGASGSSYRRSGDLMALPRPVTDQDHLDLPTVSAPTLAVGGPESELPITARDRARLLSLLHYRKVLAPGAAYSE